MSAFARSILCLLLVAVPFVPSRACAERADRFRAQIDQYQSADTEGKRRWLENLLLEQAEPACRATLSGPQLERIQQRHRAILDRAAAGGELSVDGLRRLLHEVDAQQQAAIESLARDYAYATAQAFHNERTAFDRWHDAWRNIAAAYVQAGRPPGWQARMIGWLQHNRPAIGSETAPSSTPPPQIVATPAPVLPASPAAPPTPPAAPPAPPPPIRAVAPRPRPSIQQGELEARIAGYNLALARMISELHGQTAWTAEELMRATRELSDLAAARHDLQLYWNLLPAATRARMVGLQSLDGAIALLASRTAQRRRELEFAPAANIERNAWEQRRLDDVSRQLATLAAGRS